MNMPVEAMFKTIALRKLNNCYGQNMLPVINIGKADTALRYKKFSGFFWEIMFVKPFSHNFPSVKIKCRSKAPLFSILTASTNKYVCFIRNRFFYLNIDKQNNYLTKNRLNHHRCDAQPFVQNISFYYE